MGRYDLIRSFLWKDMATDDTSSARPALLLSFLFLASIVSAPGLFASVNGEQVTHFGNNGFPQSVNITFPSGGFDTSTTLILGANSVVSASSLDVRGWQGSAGMSSNTIGIDAVSYTHLRAHET